MLWARDMGGAKALVVFDRRCPREYGETFRGRYGIEGAGAMGERGD